MAILVALIVTFSFRLLQPLLTQTTLCLDGWAYYSLAYVPDKKLRTVERKTQESDISCNVATYIY